MKLRVRAGRAALAVGSSAIFLLLAEAGVRLAGVVPPRWARPAHLESADKRFALDAYPDDPRGAFDVDLRRPAVRAAWRAKGLPGVDRVAARTPFAVGLELDEHLCRTGATGPRREGLARIVVVGDSFTEGQGVRAEDTFASRLGRRLAPRAEVLGCGRRGLDFPAIREVFEQRLALEPDVVLYAMLLNDPVQSETFRARQAFLDDWILDRRRMVGEGERLAPSFWSPRLVALASDRLEGARIGRETTRWYLDMYGEANRAGWETTVEHVAAMDEAMRARGGELLVALLPLLVGLDRHYPFAGLSGTIAEAFEARGVAFHDVTPAFLGRRPEELWVHPLDRHPNERAHEVVAEDLEPALRAALDRRRAR